MTNRIEPPAWVLTTDAPKEWRDGRWLVGKMGERGKPFTVRYNQDRWDGNLLLRSPTHLCDCIPRNEV